jgi:hypothetical protein
MVAAAALTLEILLTQSGVLSLSTTTTGGGSDDGNREVGPEPGTGTSSGTAANAPRNKHGIYEYRDANGRWYVGSAHSDTLYNRIRVHLRSTDPHPITSDTQIFWTEINEIRGPIRIAERIRTEQVATWVDGGRANMSNAPRSNSAGWGAVTNFFRNNPEPWRTIGGWPEWLNPTGLRP